MNINLLMWQFVRRFFQIIEYVRRMQAGHVSRLAAIINGWTNIGLGLVPMLIVATACWGICGVFMLSLEGWSVNAVQIWFSGAPADYPACSLRTDLWNHACLAVSFAVGVSAGADLRWCIIDNAVPSLAAFQSLRSSFAKQVLYAVAVMSALTYLTAQPPDGHQSFGQRCAAIPISEPF